MKFYPKHLPAAAILVALLVTTLFPQTHSAGGGKPQSSEGLGRTWKGPSSSVIGKILTRRPAASGTGTAAAGAAAGRKRTTTKGVSPGQAPAAPPTAAPLASLTFRPAGDTGIADALIAAFATNPSEKALLTTLFKTMRQSYESEVAKDGRSNNIAAALTFFLAVNAMVYHDLDLPSDEVTDKVYDQLSGAMVTTPEIARMTDAEKQQMHDWLVYMGGFVLAGYVEAKQNNNAETLKSFQQVAALSSKIVGVDISKVTLSAKGLDVASLEKRPFDDLIFVQALRPDRRS